MYGTQYIHLIMPFFRKVHWYIKYIFCISLLIEQMTGNGQKKKECKRTISDLQNTHRKLKSEQHTT